MTKLFKNSKSVLSFVLAFAVLAVSLFTGVVIKSDAASCKTDLNIVYRSGNNIEPDSSFLDGTHGTGTESDPYIISTPGQLRYLAQNSTSATTYGKYYKIADGIDMFVMQYEGYIKGVAGSIEAFLALDAEGTKTALSNTSATYGEATYDRTHWQGSKSDYDSFAGHLDFNGITICGIYTANGSGVIGYVNGGATLENLEVRNTYQTSGWYCGAVVGMARNPYDSDATYNYRPITFNNIIVANTYSHTTGNGWSNAGVLAGSLMNAKYWPIHATNILTYGNKVTGQASSSDTTVKDCAIFGALASSWNGEGAGVANGKFNNIVTLDCAPYPVAIQNNQCTRPAFWSNVYTTTVADFTPCTFDSNWDNYDITVLSSADLAIGAAAKTNMPKLDWANTWLTVDGAYPEFQSKHSFEVNDNGDGTHTTACSDCELSLGAQDHSFVDGVCSCGYVAKCGDIVIYWDGSNDSTLADNGEAGTEADPIIIDDAAELAYLANFVSGKTDAGKLYYKMADGIDKVVLQPQSVLNLNTLLACEDGAAVKTYFEDTVGLANLNNWAVPNGTIETWFAGTFDGNNVTFVGMYVKDGSAGLFPTVDGGATFKNIAVEKCYINGSKDKVGGETNGQCRTGAIAGGSCGIGYGAKVAGTISFDGIVVADNYIYGERSNTACAIVFGSDNGEEAVSVKNAIVYGNEASVVETGSGDVHLFNGVGSADAGTVSSVSNSIVLGCDPYYSSCNTAAIFENVYTDAEVDSAIYADIDMKNVSDLKGAELKAACTALDWTNTFLATADMPTLRNMHDSSFATVDNGDGTHSASCSCGLAIDAAAHDWSAKDGACTVCNALCAHGNNYDAIKKTEKTPATCTDAAWYYEECTICGLSSEHWDNGTYQEGDPLGHDMVLVPGTPAKCGVAGVKDYYDCSRCDYVSEDAEGKTAITNLDEWKVIAALEHTPATDESGTVYSTHDGMHYNVCGREGCGVEFGGAACESEWDITAEGHMGECTVCGVATAGREAHGNFTADHKCGTCGWECTNHNYVASTLDEDITILAYEWGNAEAEALVAQGYCKSTKTYCSVCGAQGEDQLSRHSEGEWQSMPTWRDQNYVGTCAGEGQHTECTVCTDCYNVVNTKIVTDAKTGHEFSDCEATEPTCSSTGNIAYKYCANCYNNFASDAADDEPYENAISYSDYVIDVDPEAHIWVEFGSDATCEEDGVVDHKYCSECQLFLINGEENEDVVFDYDEFYEYETDENGNFVYDDEWNRNPIGYGAIVETELSNNYYTLREEYLEANGLEYLETDEQWNDWFDYYYALEDAAFAEAYIEYFSEKLEAAEIDLVIPATGHTLVKVDEVAPTYEKDGMEAHWACECGKLYADENGETEVTAEELVIAKLVKEETKTEDKEDDKTSDTKTEGDTSTESPKTGESVASVAAVAALMGAAFVLIRKARK